MATVFDVVTVTCFVALVIAFFQFTDRGTRVLLNFLLAAIVLAVANQVGNGGNPILATILILASIGFSFVVIKR